MATSTTRPRANLLPAIDRALRHLAVDLEVPVGDLLAEGAVLLLRWHGRADGLPMPTLPKASPATTCSETPIGDHHLSAHDGSVETQRDQVVTPAPQAATSTASATTPIEEVHPDEEDEDEEVEMMPHPDELLAEAGFRVPRTKLK
jgi:hypothetical protein